LSPGYSADAFQPFSFLTPLDYRKNCLLRTEYSTVQCSTVQYSTVQYSTVQYSTVHNVPRRNPIRVESYSWLAYIRLAAGSTFRQGEPSQTNPACSAVDNSTNNFVLVLFANISRVYRFTDKNGCLVYSAGGATGLHKSSEIASFTVRT
jgi:hypothetical protein